MGESLECLIALRVEGATPEKEPENFVVKFQVFILVLHIIDLGEIFSLIMHTFSWKMAHGR